MVSTYQALVQAEVDLQKKADKTFSDLKAKREALRNDAENEDLTAEVTALVDKYEASKSELADIRSQIAEEDGHREVMRRSAAKRFDEESEEPKHEDLNPKFESFGQMLQSVVSAGLGRRVDERLRIGAVSGASEGIGSDGGFAVGTDFAQELIRNVHDTGVLVSRTSRRTASSGANSLSIRAINETDRADGSRLGGIQAFWDGEGAAITSSQEKQSKVELKLNKLTGLYYATDELLQDTTALEQEVRDWFNEEFGFKMDDAIINGTGVGQPLGIANAAALVSVSKESSQAADTVLLANLTKMYSRMTPRSRANAVWLINNDVMPQLFGLFTAVQNVAGSENVGGFAPPNFIQFSPTGDFMIAGRPVIAIEQAATLGDTGDIYFVDLSQYVVLEKGGIQAATSIHVKFVEDETAFRFTLRADGQPRWKSALTPFKGSNTLSPYVKLDERA